MSDIWRLHHGEVVVAEFHVVEFDFPWMRATVVAKPGFEAVKPLFDEELRLIDESPDEETDEWVHAYEMIRAKTRLTYPDGQDVPEYILHIDGDEAWWRWSDEAFDDT